MKTDLRKAVFLLILILVAAECSLLSYGGWKRRTEWQYLDDEGQVKKDEWFQDGSGKTYYLDKEGYMVTGWHQAENGSLYFFDQNGVMVIGLARIDDRLYFFEENGAAFFGDRLVGGVNCHFTPEGFLHEELAREAHWYYLEDGQVQDGEGWKQGYYLGRIPGLVLLICGVLLWFWTRNRSSRLYPWLIYGAVFLVSIPLFLPYLVRGHDMSFHLNRILGIRGSLGKGMFPVRLNSFSFNGYGYADPVFYPNVYLYLPAILSGIGVPLPAAVHLFLLVVHFATAIVMYKCSSSLFESKEIGCMSSVIYTLCTYRLCNAYTRAAYGEMMAMLFFPLVIYGFYEVFFRDESSWFYLTLGLTGVIQSHLISTMLVGIICVAAGLFWIRQMFTPRRFVACVKAVSASVLLNLWFLLPLLQYMRTDIDTSALQRYVEGESAEPFGLVLESFSRFDGESTLVYRDLSRALPASLGLVFLCGAGLFFYGWFIRKRNYNKAAKVLFGAGIFFAFAATDLFPWTYLTKSSLFRLFVSYVQFPWRFVGLAACFLAMASAYGFWSFFEFDLKKRKIACVTVLLLAMISSKYFIDDYQRQRAYVWSEQEVGSVIDQNEYLYPGTDKSSLNPNLVSSEPVRLKSAGKNGLSVTFIYEGNPGFKQGYVDVPLLYYPGYHAFQDEGRELEISRSEHNKIRVALEDEEGTVQVFFKEPFLWRMSEVISLLTGVLIVWEWYRRKGYGRISEKRKK